MLVGSLATWDWPLSTEGDRSHLVLMRSATDPCRQVWRIAIPLHRDVGERAIDVLRSSLRTGRLEKQEDVKITTAFAKHVVNDIGHGRAVLRELRGSIQNFSPGRPRDGSNFGIVGADEQMRNTLAGFGGVDRMTDERFAAEHPHVFAWDTFRSAPRRDA